MDELMDQNGATTKAPKAPQVLNLHGQLSPRSLCTSSGCEEGCFQTSCVPQTPLVSNDHAYGLIAFTVFAIMTAMNSQLFKSERLLP